MLKRQNNFLEPLDTIFQQEDNQVFHKLAEIGNNGNIGITGFTTWKQEKNPAIKCYLSKH